MRIRIVMTCALAAGCRIEPNPDFDEIVAQTSTSQGTSTSGPGTSESTAAGSSSTGEIPEGCYDDIVVEWELCFEYRPITLGEDTLAVAAADFNADGNPDVLVAANGSARIFYGNGDGAFLAVRQLLPSMQSNYDGAGGVAAPDLNDDGFADVVVGYPASETVDVYLSYEDGSFTEADAYTVAGGPSRVVAADVDDDGLLDLVTANTAGNSVTVLYGTGGGVLEARPAIPAGMAPMSVTVADLDHNGLADIVAAPSDDTFVSLLINADDRTFSEPFPLPLEERTPITVLLADLDGDGPADLFVSTESQENFVLYGLDGPGVDFEEAWWNWTGRTAFAAATGDFNADGVTDIAWAEGWLGNGGMSWMLGDGERGFVTELNPLYTFPIDLAVADFNHDGVDDVVLANVASDIGLGLLLSVP